uniref:Uncharacterized protein n=1 Tax=Oryza brachyantha TaxID=4533 RepID=J3LNP3_ORYBR
MHQESIFCWLHSKQSLFSLLSSHSSTSASMQRKRWQLEPFIRALNTTLVIATPKVSHSNLSSLSFWQIEKKIAFNSVPFDFSNFSDFSYPLVARLYRNRRFTWHPEKYDAGFLSCLVLKLLQCDLFLLPTPPPRGC